MADEPILVVDIGSSSVKAGFSGEDVPSYIFPSTTTKSGIKNMESMEAFMGENTGAASQYVNTLSTHPISRGVVKDWDQMEKLWHHIAETVNLSSNESTSIFIVESHKSTALDRVKWADLLFDTCHSPSICIGNSASLTIFAAGRTTGVAVECGAGLTSAVPIFEGLALKHAAVSMDFGGQDITFALKKLFNDKNHAIDMLSAKLIKERLSYVHGYATFSGSVTSTSTNSHGKTLHTEQATFALPDGTDVTVDPRILSQCTDLLFENRSLSSGGLVSQVHEAIALCDDSVKRDLAANIVLSGGTTLLPGLGDKLNQALTQRFAHDADMRNNMIAHSMRVVPHSNYRERGYSLQRKHAAWIGGSLLGSFDTYHRNLKITRQEWEENPDVVLNTRSF